MSDGKREREMRARVQLAVVRATNSSLNAANRALLHTVEEQARELEMLGEEARRGAAPCTPLGALNLELFGRPAKEMHHEAFHVLSVLSEWAGSHSFDDALKALKKRLNADPGNPW